MYYVTGPDGTESGPFPLETLVEWARSGQLPPEAPVRVMGGEPLPANRVEGLSNVYRPTGSKMIPTGNPAALWGYYLSIITLFPLIGALFLPFSFGRSMAGLKAYREDPGVHGKAHCIVGLVLSTIGLLIQALLWIGVIAAVSASQRRGAG